MKKIFAVTSLVLVMLTFALTTSASTLGSSDQVISIGNNVYINTAMNYKYAMTYDTVSFDNSKERITWDMPQSIIISNNPIGKDYTDENVLEDDDKINQTSEAVIRNSEWSYFAQINFNDTLTLLDTTGSIWYQCFMCPHQPAENLTQFYGMQYVPTVGIYFLKDKNYEFGERILAYDISINSWVLEWYQYCKPTTTPEGGALHGYFSTNFAIKETSRFWLNVLNGNIITPPYGYSTAERKLLFQRRLHVIPTSPNNLPSYAFGKFVGTGQDKYYLRNKYFASSNRFQLTFTATNKIISRQVCFSDQLNNMSKYNGDINSLLLRKDDFNMFEGVTQHLQITYSVIYKDTNDYGETAVGRNTFHWTYDNTYDPDNYTGDFVKISMLPEAFNEHLANSGRDKDLVCINVYSNHLDIEATPYQDSGASYTHFWLNTIVPELSHTISTWTNQQLGYFVITSSSQKISDIGKIAANTAGGFLNTKLFGTFGLGDLFAVVISVGVVAMIIHYFKN